MFYSLHHRKFEFMTDTEKQQLLKLGSLLRFYRLQKNFSQEKLSELTELDRTYISGLERGLRNPSFLIIKKLSDVLDINPQQLFEGDIK